MSWRDNDDDDDWDDDGWDDEEWPDEQENALVECPHCHSEIYEDVEQCPYCQNYLSQEDAPAPFKPWWIVLGTIVCLIIISRWMWLW